MAKRKLTGIANLGVRLFDARGKQVRSASPDAAELDLSTLPAGHYWACASQGRQDPFTVALEK